MPARVRFGPDFGGSRSAKSATGGWNTAASATTAANAGHPDKSTGSDCRCPEKSAALDRRLKEKIKTPPFRRSVSVEIAIPPVGLEIIGLTADYKKVEWMLNQFYFSSPVSGWFTGESRFASPPDYAPSPRLPASPASWL